MMFGMSYAGDRKLKSPELAILLSLGSQQSPQGLPWTDYTNMAVGPVQHQALPKICKHFSAYFEFHTVSFTTVVPLPT